MMMRKLPILVGAHVRTSDAYPYSLPKGLADNAKVEVLSYDSTTYRHIVRDLEGREWTIIARQNLDAGSEYTIGGRWLPENHPLAVHELRRLEEPKN